MAYKRIGIAGAIVAALSVLGLSHSSPAVLPNESRAVQARRQSSKGNTTVLRDKRQGRKTMTVPQMRRAAAKRRNMIKRGQR